MEKCEGCKFKDKHCPEICVIDLKEDYKFNHGNGLAISLEEIK